MYTLLWLLLLVISTSGAEERIERIVKTSQGLVRGYKEPGDDLFVFYGIPYATAPKGVYKFKAPYAPPTWLQPFEAVEKDIICHQGILHMEMMPNKTMTDDCLIANVFVPDTDKKNLPVVVYVHGGAYQMGYSNLATPKNLVRSKKVIAVTFNYRLGIHGFLCLGTKDVPGNAGMKDQVALLKWVQKNIAGYGGNPADVTIAGYSAGSSAVDLLMLSPSTKGLFNKVIPESGANIAVFSVQLDPVENAKNHAKVLGFKNIDDIYALEEFYKTASFEVLTADTFIDRTDSNFMFSPCVERNTGAGEFLTKSPYEILKTGDYRKVPILYGFANMEGMLRVPFFDLWKNKMNENFADFLPADLKFDSDKERENVVEQIKSFYFGGEPVTEDNILSYIDYFSDIIFAFPTLRALKFHAEAGHDKVFLYEYSFVHESTPVIPHTGDKKGADHCTQSMAVLDIHNWGNNDESTVSEEYKEMKTLMRDIWINFIASGVPSSTNNFLPDWPAADGRGSPHMSLGNKIELRGAYQEERMRFWQNIYDRHYRVPVPPPSPPHSEL